LSRRTYGILASVIGSALGVWWWNRQRASARNTITAARDHGTLIFENTPVASSGII
jgi:hypothetical protein